MIAADDTDKDGGGTDVDPMDVERQASLKSWGEPVIGQDTAADASNVVIDCGWGRLIFAQTFEDPNDVAREVMAERQGQRDVALYLREPHVVLAQAPQNLFLDPSHTFRLVLAGAAIEPDAPRTFHIRPMKGPRDAESANAIYMERKMVPAYPGFYEANEDREELVQLVAEDKETGAVIGVVTGVDHGALFNDPDNGSSLWALAVAPQTPVLGVGEGLIKALAAIFRDRGRAFMDLSVLHNNDGAIKLYEKLGFERVPVLCLKNKNPINEKLFIGPDSFDGYNPYARIILDEARRRGIAVEAIEPEAGYFALSFGGRTVVCRESLSELTSAVAMSRCDDKAVTRRLLARAGLRVPEQTLIGPNTVGRSSDIDAFLAAHPRVVVKPARGEQGQGITVDVSGRANVEAAILQARQVCERVIIESYHPGFDVRIIVIDHKLVAAAVRRPPEVTGDGKTTIRELIEKQSRRRAAATGGESRIPIDAETERYLAAAGHALDDVLADGVRLTVRKAANLHMGGTIHDITDTLHRSLVEAAVNASVALNIPVVGLDFIVPDLAGPDYVIIEANERPGLANHEPQPTAERFIDLLFPQTRFSPASDNPETTTGSP